MISESIFRENDIRGTYPEELNESVIKEIAKGIAKKCFQEDEEHREKECKNNT